MLKKITAKIPVVGMILMLVGIDVLADIRIRFARGRTSATVKGKVGRGGRICYIAGAKAGQTLSANISSRSGKVMIFESGETSYSQNVEYSGDQSICVDNIAGATTYTLTVSIQ